ncbi:MAG: hypothetical protein HZC37_02890 [Burkholderiales bacterium]|nr:hypothetical protein [Burkholderiales bacterium]
MGHVRLGTLPRTRNWIQVLDLVGSGAGAPHIAAATMEASQRGLAKAAQDPGLVYTVWLLTQVPLAARSKDFVARLHKLGLQVSDSPSLLEVTGAFADAVDAHLRRTGGRTDLGEMAQMAASEALTALGTPANASLFETTTPTAQQTIGSFTTARRFSALAAEFFTRLTRKYLTYFLSRELSNYVGVDGRFPNVDRHAEFNSALDLHCRQASLIIEEFSGGWFSKGNFKGPITQKNAAGYVHVALKKLRAELAKGTPGGE